MGSEAERENCPPLDPDVIEPEYDADETGALSADAHLFHAAFSGPLPPPSLFREYDEILPGAAERILSLVESEARHQHEVENKALEVAAENRPSGRFGALVGLVVALAFAGIALAMVLTDYPWPATAVVITEVAGLVGIFVYGMRARSGEPPG